MAPHDGTQAMASRPLPWCLVQSAKMVRRLPLIASKGPYSCRYLGNKKLHTAKGGVIAARSENPHFQGDPF